MSSDSGYSIDSAQLSVDTYNYISKFIVSPIALFIVCLILLVLYGIRGKGQGDSTTILEVIVWTVFTLLILLNGFLYFFGIEITTYFDKFLQGKTTIGVDVEDKGLRDQVFHIRDNKYSYPDAKAICQAYGGRLATYQEIEEAYNNGGEWCSYGWSADQLALFPTQYDTWKKKQQDCDIGNNDCGRPGINGGFIDNPLFRFGVNCYGTKPRITEDEKEMMENDEFSSTNKKDQLIDERSDYWSDNLDDLTITPFNRKQWNEFNYA